MTEFLKKNVLIDFYVFGKIGIKSIVEVQEYNFSFDYLFARGFYKYFYSS